MSIKSPLPAYGRDHQSLAVDPQAAACCPAWGDSGSRISSTIWIRAASGPPLGADPVYVTA